MERTRRIFNCEPTFRMECPKTWDALEETSNPLVRSCSSCSRTVHLCSSLDQATREAEAGHCVAIQVRGGTRLGQLVVQEDLITLEELRIARAFSRPDEHQSVAGDLASTFGVPHIVLDDVDIDSRTAMVVPAGFAREHALVPVNHTGNVLIVAMSNPDDVESVKSLVQVTGLRVEVVVAHTAEIQRALTRVYGNSSSGTGNLADRKNRGTFR